MSSDNYPSTNYLTRKSVSNSIAPKPLGMILLEADLVSPSQIKVALQDQTYNPDLLLGEILAMRNWIQPKTADFFARDWSNLVQNRQKSQKPLGWYLEKSALLKQEDIQIILKEQQLTGIRFGTVAVLQGLLKSTTLDFFLMYLCPQKLQVSSFQYSPSYENKKKSVNEKWQTNFEQNNDELSDTEDFEITWIG